MKVWLRIVIPVCGGMLFLSPARGGEIQGRITVTRVLTPKRVNQPSYQLRGPALPPLREESTAVDEFSKMAVYLEGAGLPPPGAATPTLTQKNKRFDPEILVIPVGSKVSFPNADPIFHNVFSLSKTKQFDLGYYPAGESRTVEFAKAGIVQVYCHLHSDMSAAILVVPNGANTRPGKDGTFVLSNIPAGTYQVVIWHKAAGFFRKEIAVPEAGSVAVSFLVPLREGETIP